MRHRLKMHAVTVALAVGLLWLGPTAPAHAEDNACATRDKVLSHLSGAYGEAPVAIGVANNGGVIEVMRSTETRTFTILITMPDGMTCMIAAGSNWEDLPAVTHDARL